MAALAELVARADRGEIALWPETDVVNMHCHTFFSFNGYGHSPASLAWLAKKRGFRAIGIVDFDVLDAVDEFLTACDMADVRGSAGIETRVFIPEFATRVINSPGEPGVYYHMGIGFVAGQVADPGAAAILADMRAQAERRNREMLARLNAHLDPVTLDYERDVLPLTPAGNATERHMLAAFIRAAENLTLRPPFPSTGSGQALSGNGETASLPQRESYSPLLTGEGQGVRSFWAEKLGLPVELVAAAFGDYARFANLVRARLMKRGGVGYVAPSPAAFPAVDAFHTMILACGALPCATWLDGMSEGERDIDELLALLIEQGVVALNIIPDRNWNLADPETRALKVGKLYEVVEKAQALDLPLNVGTEMNTPGQKLVDDFDAPELAPVRDAFLDGAHFIYGHTVMQRGLGLSYQSRWAQMHLPTRRARNAFYTAVGYRVPPGRAGLARLGSLDPACMPDEILAAL